MSSYGSYNSINSSANSSTSSLNATGPAFMVHPIQAMAFTHARNWVEREREAEIAKTAADPGRPVRTVTVGFRIIGAYKRTLTQKFRLVPKNLMDRRSTNTHLARVAEKFLPITPLRKTLNFKCVMDESKISRAGPDESRRFYFSSWYWLRHFVGSTHQRVYQVAKWVNPNDFPVSTADRATWAEAIRLFNKRHCGHCVPGLPENLVLYPQTQTTAPPASFEQSRLPNGNMTVSPNAADDTLVITIDTDQIEIETSNQWPHDGFLDWRHDPESFQYVRNKGEPWLTMVRHEATPGQELQGAVCLEERAEGAKEFTDWLRDSEDQWDLNNPHKWHQLPVRVIAVRHHGSQPYDHRTLGLPTHVCVWDQYDAPRFHKVIREPWEYDDVELNTLQDTWNYLEAREYIERERINAILNRADEPDRNAEKVSMTLRMCSGKRQIKQTFVLLASLGAQGGTPVVQKKDPILCEFHGETNRACTRVSLMNLLPGFDKV